MMKQFTLSRTLMACLIACVALLGGCATPPPYDYAAFKQSRPKSLIVLPPINESPEVKATYGVLSQVTFPLAEAGYYVLPVSLVDSTFKENGVSNPVEMHESAPAKLREIFGADAAVYISVKRYGASYNIVSGDAVVAVEGRIVDLATGQQIWSGSAVASSAESNGANQGGLVGLLIQAVVSQILNTLSDSSFRVAGVADQRLFRPGHNGGLLWGPRSPNFGKE